MPRTKQPSKRTGRKREVVPVLGLVGVSLSLAGGASAANIGPVADIPTQDRVPTPGREITLSEEEISDVSLGTFYVFDKETAGTPSFGQRFAQRGCRGCGGCRGCRGCARACRGCAGCGGCGGGGCGCGCCWQWGVCRVC